MKNTKINLAVIQKIAKALGSLNDDVVYVGGAVVSLYINDPAADDVRPTKDVDISLRIASLTELEDLRVELAKKGFHPHHEDKGMCRFRYEDVLVDVMSTKEVGWAPANPWFAPGFDHLESRDIKDRTIRILSLPYFLATKFEAFKNRGSKDPRTSHDFEDITYILDNRKDLAEVLLAAPKDVLGYLNERVKEILENDTCQEAMMGNLYHETQTERLDMILDKLKQIVKE